jgi:hypothetical protein
MVSIASESMSIAVGGVSHLLLLGGATSRMILAISFGAGEGVLLTSASSASVTSTGSRLPLSIR